MLSKRHVALGTGTRRHTDGAGDLRLYSSFTIRSSLMSERDDNDYNSNGSSDSDNDMLHSSGGALEEFDDALGKYQDIVNKKMRVHSSKIIWTFWFLLKSVVSC